MNLFQSAKYGIEVGGQGWLLITSNDHFLCRKLNRVLGTYGDYTHKPGEEGQFKLRSLLDLSKILATPPFQGLGTPVVEEMKKVLKG